MAYRLTLQACVLLFGVTGTLVAIWGAAQPYLWIFPLWGSALLLVAVLNRRSLSRALSINGAVAFIVLGAAETYWSTAPNLSEQYFGTYTENYFEKHAFLGHAPAKGVRVTSKRIYAQQTLYDVVYTIDPQGLRISAPHREDMTECLLFFGGSFTFGEGVGDEETMPYRVGVHSGGQYRFYNFGFHGYGPHQMLSALEHGVVDKSIECAPRHIFYLGMGAHIARSAGLVPWEHHGPWYVLQSDGEARFAGRFDEQPVNRLVKELRLGTSHIYRKTLGKERPIRQQDIDLYIAIVTTAAKRVSHKYPGARFHVLLWSDEKDRDSPPLVVALREKGLDVHTLDQMIPSYHQDPLFYHLSPYDDHPNASTHDLVARYVVNTILPK